MTDYTIEKFTEEYAREICTWKYENEYAVYNFSDYHIVEKNKGDLAIREKREAEFVAIVQNNELVAFGNITANDGKSIIGVGLKPNFCGKGHGKDIMKMLIGECKKRYPQNKVALEVRTFNKRALKCYLDVGFEIKDKYVRAIFDDKGEFYYMEYSLQ
jgi:ribosomal protein S18 acetylase RimI-like enzyme